MTMLITECLNSEHQVFLGQLDILRQLCDDNASNDVLKAVVHTIASAVESHATIEEQRLYPAIREAYGDGFPPLIVMEREHTMLRRLVDKIRTGEFEVESVHQFAEVLQGHILKEIQVLFPMAERAIPPEHLSELCSCAPTADCCSIGACGH